MRLRRDSRVLVMVVPRRFPVYELPKLGAEQQAAMQQSSPLGSMVTVEPSKPAAGGKQG